MGPDADAAAGGVAAQRLGLFLPHPRGEALYAYGRGAWEADARLHPARRLSLIDPAAELDALLTCDPRAAAGAPLFRDVSTGFPVTVQLTRDVVKAIARASGLDPANYGAHSIR